MSPHDIRGASTVTHFFSQNFLDFKPIIEMLNFLCTGNMVMKQQHKTRYNGDKQHKDGLNADRDMTNSSKCETTVFEIYTRDIHFPHLGLIAECPYSYTFV